MLNAILQKQVPEVYTLLSTSGRRTFFPKESVVAQTAEANETKLNATIGQALEDNHTPLTLSLLKEQTKLTLEQTFLYSPSYGQKKLRELWQEAIYKKNPSLKAKISLPLVVGGLTHGLSVVNKLFVDEGDSIILPDKYWGNYKLIFDPAELATFPLYDKRCFNAAGLAKKLAEKGSKKIVLLNFPNNPTGYTPTEREAEEIREIIKKASEKNKVIVILDDAYFGLVYEKNILKESLFARLADLSENVLAVKVDGISKELYAWGLRVAFVTYGCKGLTQEAAKALEDKTAGVVRGTISNVNSHAQFMAVSALESKKLE